MFMGEAGREMVGKYAQDVTDYYCMASELDNHCVRESACHSIAEMAEKVKNHMVPGPYFFTVAVAARL